MATLEGKLYGQNIVAPHCWVDARNKQNTDYSGKTWVAGKAEPISPRVAASLGEPMLGGNTGWTRRGVPFWEDNRSDGTMAPWRDPDLFPRVAIALTVGQSAA